MMLNRLNVLSGHLVHNLAWKKMVISSSSKGFATSQNSNFLKSGVFLNPHHQKKHKGGEDAAAITQNMVAVADGVGGWAESGVDPAVYSKKLC